MIVLWSDEVNIELQCRFLPTDEACDPLVGCFGDRVPGNFSVFIRAWQSSTGARSLHQKPRMHHAILDVVAMYRPRSMPRKGMSSWQDFSSSRIANSDCAGTKLIGLLLFLLSLSHFNDNITHRTVFGSSGCTHPVRFGIHDVEWT
jgi:hypothetical protein